MYPPLFEICDADTSVQSILGDGPTLRVYPFASVPQDEKKPYAAWQLVYGSPANYLGQLPDADSIGTQIDVYGVTATSARNAAMAIRNAVEPFAYVTSWDGESRDPVTKNYRFSFTVDWIVER